MIRFPFSKPAPEEVEAEEPAPTLSPEQQEAQEAQLDAAFRALRASVGEGEGDVDRGDDGSVDDADQRLETGQDEDGIEIESISIDAALDGEDGRSFAEGDAVLQGDAEEPFGGPIDSTPMEEQMRMIEAMLFASEKPLSTAELASRMPLGCDAAVAVRRLEEIYAGRGVALARVAGKWAFRTAPDLAHLLTGEAVEQRRLSRAAVETLAIVAYHQPVTRAEIEEIRQVGVSKGTLDLLMELEWIKLGRRRQTPGRPVTFVTTDKFLEHFGLESLKDLPRLEELRQSGLLDSTPPKGFSPRMGGEEGEEDEELEDEAASDLDEEESQEDFLV